MSLRQTMRRVRARATGELDVAAYRAKGALIGDNVWIGPRSRLDPAVCFLITIGDDVVIAPNVTVLCHDASLRRREGFTRLAPVSIGDRVFIGACALIMPGVRIGADAVIAAGSVVTKDVAAGTVVAGNPARELTTTKEYAERSRGDLERAPKYNEATPGAGFRPDQWDEVRRATAEHGLVWDS